MVTEQHSDRINEREVAHIRAVDGPDNVAQGS
jgi:hypothetical protein